MDRVDIFFYFSDSLGIENEIKHIKKDKIGINDFLRDYNNGKGNSL